MESFFGFNTNYQGPYTMANTFENVCVAKEVGQHIILEPETVVHSEKQSEYISE